MTSEQKEIISALRMAIMLPGSWNKRFVRTITDKPKLTEKQG